MALHLRHAGRIEPAMFARRLELLRATTDELLPPAPALAMQARVARIAESLRLVLRFRRPEGHEAMLAPKPADRPNRSTPMFDQATLPAALRRAHSAKADVWGVVRVLEGKLCYTIEADGANAILDPHAGAHSAAGATPCRADRRDAHAGRLPRP